MDKERAKLFVNKRYKGSTPLALAMAKFLNKTFLGPRNKNAVTVATVKGSPRLRMKRVAKLRRNRTSSVQPKKD